MQLGCTYLAEKQFRFAREALERSLALKENCWALCGLACLEKSGGDKEKAGRIMLQAVGGNLSDVSLAVATARYVHEAAMYKQNIEFIERLPEAVAANSRIRMYYVYALLRVGKLEKAEQLLYADGGIDVADIREGEISITELWFDLEEAKAVREGYAFDRAKAIPPKQFDFRMHAK